MGIIEVITNDVAVEREAPETVLELPESGPSAVGSTYWRRVLSCPREHFLANELRWAPKRRSLALDMGIAWHAVLEVYYRAWQRRQQKTTAPDEEPPDVIAYRLLQRFQRATGWNEHSETLTRMFAAYFENYDHIDCERWEVVAVEASIQLEADFAGFPYSSRLDLNILDHTTRTPVFKHVEHKSTGRFDYTVISGYTQDLQVLGQCWLMEHGIDYTKYPPYAGGIVNLTSKAKEPRLARIPVTPAPQQLEAWEEGLRFGQKYRLALAGQKYPRNYAHCVGRYGRCQFFDLCQSRPQDTADDLRRFDEEDNLPGGVRRANIWDIEETTG